ncbi:hypothetical protein ABZ477_12610 [Microbacterium sp. NPDC019599]|uniref:hypothetical protein n=1 Tax=Microbacterium sp. NPDC019599 TaxID=3154690 RepID=UPI00340E5163
MIRVRLHENVTAESLGLARILVFAIWIGYVLVDPVQRLTLLPTELFHSYGVFRLLPDEFWAAVLTPAGLLGLTTVCLVLFVWAGLGFRGARAVTAAAVIAALVYLQVKKGFGGHFDHRELTLVYVTAALLLTPAWDAFAVSRSRRAGARRPDVYRSSLIVLSFVVILQYVFIGTARLFIGGPGVFMNGTLQNWVENRNLRPNPFGFDLGTYFLDPFWAIPLDLLFLGGTILEITAILLLFLPPGWLKVLFLVGFTAFHSSIFLLMNVAFPENIVLLLLFFDLAWPLRRMRAGHDTAGAAIVDPGNPAAAAFVAEVRAETVGVSYRDAAGTSGGLEFIAADAEASASSGAPQSATGERARTEILYRRPGWLGVAWTRDHVLRRSGPIRSDRTGFGRWLLGPVVDESGSSRH